MSSKPFTSADMQAALEHTEMTWFQRVAVQAQAHPGWTVTDHLFALRARRGMQFDLLAQVYGSTPEALVREALAGAQGGRNEFRITQQEPAQRPARRRRSRRGGSMGHRGEAPRDR